MLLVSWDRIWDRERISAGSLPRVCALHCTPVHRPLHLYTGRPSAPTPPLLSYAPSPSFKVSIPPQLPKLLSAIVKNARHCNIICSAAEMLLELALEPKTNIRQPCLCWIRLSSFNKSEASDDPRQFEYRRVTATEHSNMNMNIGTCLAGITLCCFHTSNSPCAHMDGRAIEPILT